MCLGGNPPKTNKYNKDGKKQEINNIDYSVQHSQRRQNFHLCVEVQKSSSTPTELPSTTRHSVEVQKSSSAGTQTRSTDFLTSCDYALDDCMSGDLKCLEVENFESIVSGRYSDLAEISGKEQLAFYRRLITVDHVKIIASSIAFNFHCKQLDLSYNSLDSRAIFYLNIALRYNTQLEDLWLNHNNINDVSDIANMLEKTQCSLVNLRLSGNEITLDGITKIAKALKEYTNFYKRRTLKTITVNNKKKKNAPQIDIENISGYGRKHLKPGLRKTLSLYRKHYDCYDTIIICSIINRSSEKCLTHVDLSWNEFGNHGAHAVARMLESNNTLKFLNISNNQIEDNGITGPMGIAAALAKNTVLTHLNIAKNKFKEAAAEKIACALKKNSTLTELVLSSNAINIQNCKGNVASINCHRKLYEDMDIVVIASLITSNKSLQKLVLSDNSIGDHGARSLAEALRTNKSLQKLILHRNNIGNRGARAFAEALPTNCILKELDLSHNVIETNESQALAALRTKNRKIMLEKL